MQAIEPGIEIASMADIPAGTGLGSSGTFTVGLLRALHALQRRHVSARQLAEEACRIEIDVLDQPVGKQDQYIAAFGGLTCFQFHPDESVDVAPLAVPEPALHELEEHLLLFFTGYSRSASIDPRRPATSGRPTATRRCSTRSSSPPTSAERIKAALEAGDCAGFAKLMNEHWEYKRQRSPGMSNASIDELVPAGAGQRRRRRQARRRRRRRLPAVLRRGPGDARGRRWPPRARGDPVPVRLRWLDRPRPRLTSRASSSPAGWRRGCGRSPSDCPKILLPVAGEPFAAHQLRWLAVGGRPTTSSSPSATSATWSRTSSATVGAFGLDVVVLARR